MPWVVVVHFAPLAAGRNLSEAVFYYCWGGGWASMWIESTSDSGADAWTSLVPAVITPTVRPSDILIPSMYVTPHC